VVFFLYWEPRAPFPVVSFKALKERNIWISNVNGAIVGIGMFLIFVTLTILVEDPFSPGFGYSEFQMGLVAFPSALGMLAFAPVWGRLVAAKGPKPVMLVGFAVMGLGALGLVLFHSTILELILFSIPALVGNVAVLIAMSNIIVLSVSPKELGIQTGMNQTFRNLGSAVGPVLAATMTASFTAQAIVFRPPSPAPPVMGTVPGVVGFEVLFGITAAVALIGLILSLGLRNYRFRADGTRYDTSAEKPSVAPPVEPAPALSADRSS